MERHRIGDVLGSEGAGIFFFIEQLDPPHPNAIVIEIELFGVINGVTDLDALADIGGGDFVERTLEADGGIVINYPFVVDEEDLIEFGPGESADEHPAHGGVIAVDGSFRDAGVKFMVVVVLEPERKGLVELLQGKALLESREETFADGPKKSVPPFLGKDYRKASSG